MLGLELLIVIGILVVNLLATHSHIIVGHRHVAGLVGKLALPEALPLVTGHDVEVMLLREILIILSVGTQGGVTLYLLPVALLAVVHTTRGSGRAGEEVGVLTTL